MKSASGKVFLRISKWATYIVLILAPVFAFPAIPVSFLYTKVGFIHAFVFIGIVAYVISVFCEKEIKIPSIIFTILIKLLVLVGIVSAFFSIIPSLSFMGTGTDIDTLYMTALFVTAGYLASVHFTEKKDILIVVLWFIFVAVLSAIFYDLRFLFGSTFLSFGIFNQISANTIGTLADLSLYANIALIMTAILVESVLFNKIFKGLLYVGGAVLLVLVVATNFNILVGLFATTISVPITIMTALFLAGVGAHALRTYKSHKKFPYFTAITAVLLIIASTWSVSIGNFVVKHAGFTPAETLDIRVSPSASLTSIKHTYSENLVQTFIGTGQGTYFTEWAKSKPVTLPDSVNITAFWNTDFNSGFSFLSTIAVTSGLLGLLVWICLLVSVIYMLRYICRLTDPVYLLFGLPALFLLITAFLYTPGLVAVLLMFMCCGISFGLYGGIAEQRLYKSAKISYVAMRGVALVLVQAWMVIFILITCYVTHIWIHKAEASYHANTALLLAQKGVDGVEDSQKEMLRAITLDPSNTYLRFLSELSLLRPGLALESGPKDIDAGAYKKVETDINVAIRSAESAVYGQGKSVDYRDWIQLGKVYEVATFLGSTTTAPLTLQAYTKAGVLAPTNPVPPYLVARLYYYAKQRDLSLQQVKSALLLKPNYEEALELFSVLNATSTEK